MLIRIKNAGNAGNETVIVPHSNLLFSVAMLLAREGYVASATKKTRDSFPVIEIVLAYNGKKPRITNVDRVSKLSKRVYAGMGDIHPVRQGTGMLVLSTPKGVMTDVQAREAHVGGEVLFKVW